MIKPVKKIVLITSGQPSLNPRLVKEADALSEAGYHVTVIYQYWNEWGNELDRKLLLNKYWEAIRVGGSPQKGRTVYFLCRLIQKVAFFLINKFNLKVGLAEFAIARSGFLLLKEAKKYKADIYIAHNLGALAAAVRAAKKNNAKCGFDAEDFHRNEVSDDPNNIDVRLKSFIEDKYFPFLDYLTTASPIASEKYQELYPKHSPITILNTFPKVNETIVNKRQPSADRIKLFWFSQTIGKKRGLEELILAVSQFSGNLFEIHLLGDCRDEIKKELMGLTIANNLSPDIITFYKPVPPDEIITFAAQFDIGLALETGFSHNNNIALSNKLFTYFQAGLALIISDTNGQEQFLQHYEKSGVLCKRKDHVSLVLALDFYFKNRNELKKTQEYNFSLGQQVLNWENEKIKFLKVIQSTIK